MRNRARLAVVVVALAGLAACGHRPAGNVGTWSPEPTVSRVAAPSPPPSGACLMTATAVPRPWPTAAGSPWSMLVYNTFPSSDELNDVVALADGTAWAVGGRFEVGPGPACGAAKTRRALVERWDGSRWQEMAAPDGADEFHAVAASSGDDVWAFGLCGTQPCDAHWDGRSWTIDAQGDQPVTDAVASGGGQVWAVQTKQARRWDGRRWQMTTPPFEVEAITAGHAPGEVWAVGAVHSGDTVSAAAARWNGASWTTTPLPVLPRVKADQQVVLHEVAAAGSTDIWARGLISWDCDEDCGGMPLLVMHWNGAEWSYALQHGMSPTRVSAIDVSRWTGLWQAGGGSMSLYLTDGRWVSAALPRDRQRDTFVKSLAMQPGAARMWVVGFVAPEADEAGEDPSSNSVIWTSLLK
ncbi:hypothetical protein J5X84_27730 [Streptosporangiaceae bacterium NEAU-GS5]|nr:hypothetical protein [Streptosporangiaceae bacterium NEAU-GS5]